MKKLTTNEFIDKLTKVRNDIEIIGDYLGNNQKIKAKCKIHNCEFEQRASYMLEGRIACECCKDAQRHNLRLNTKKVMEKLQNYNSKLTLLNEYTGIDCDLRLMCADCGNEFKRKYANIRPSIVCPFCRPTFSNHIEYEKYLNDTKIQVIPKEKFVSMRTKILHECLIHNKEWSITPDNVLKKHGCPLCRKEKFRNKVIISLEIYNDKLHKVNPYISGLEYNGVHYKSLHYCDRCNNVFEIEPHHLLDGTSNCPYCQIKSYGESVIENTLKNNNIQYIPQYTFDDCKYKRKLPFDFAIVKNNNVLCLIEYQGEQHYHPVRFGGISYESAIKNFKSNVIRDNIKRDYCKKNDIQLFEIKYTDFDNIENILFDLGIINQYKQEAS